MLRVKTPPIRMINIAKCYRRQSDVSHVQMFHQFEGLVVGDDISIVNLKGTLDYFAKSFFGPKDVLVLDLIIFSLQNHLLKWILAAAFVEAKAANFVKLGGWN